MAFVTSSSPACRSAFLGRVPRKSSRNPRLPPPRASTTASLDDAADWFRAFTKRVSSNAAAPPPSNVAKEYRNAPKEYRTLTDAPNVDLASLPATVVSVNSVCRSRAHVQITLRVPVSLSASHVAPGQFVQLARELTSRLPNEGGRQVCFATIASAPERGDGTLEFLVAAGADPLQLARMKVGDKVAVSPVIGEGLDHAEIVKGAGNLFIFADAPQGFAAAKSLVEWGRFRAASGEGANRKNFVTVFYAIPNGRALPYADRLSAWSVYGVNVVPLAGVSVMEYLSVTESVGHAGRNVTSDFAMGCVASDETFEALFCSLILFGFRRTAVQRFTQEVLAKEAQTSDESEEWGMGSFGNEEGSKPSGMPDDAYQQMKRDRVEKEVWQSWVDVRESMRADFERKWAAQARVNREQEKGESEKRQAWASWSAKNSSQWSQVAWDTEQWGQYWSSWHASDESWASKNGAWHSNNSTGSSSSSGGGTWRQQDSQEYWDWVGRGAGSGKSSASRGGGGYSSANRSYRENYGGSQAWGNSNNQWSGYQKGGYKYQYEETAEDRTKKNERYGQSNKSNSSSNSGWSGWNRSTSGRRSTSSGSQRNWNTGRSGAFGDLDFYNVLGINSGASRADIKRAYRRKAMEHHPDRNPHRSEEAHVAMKQIVVAWSVLKDEGKRRKYDSYGPGGL